MYLIKATLASCLFCDVLFCLCLLQQDTVPWDWVRTQNPNIPPFFIISPDWNCVIWVTKKTLSRSLSLSGQSLMASCCFPTRWENEKAPLGPVYKRAVLPFLKLLPSQPNYPPCSERLRLTTARFRIFIQEFGFHTGITNSLCICTLQVVLWKNSFKNICI